MTILATISHADAGLTALLAAVLAADLRPGDCIRLEGDLGAGKSHFARALIRARLRDPMAEVPSPSFTLVQAYDDPDGVPIWHADLYRLSDPAELDELGLDEALPQAITLVEWPDRADSLPDDALTVSLSPGRDHDHRQITLSGPVGRWPSIARAVEVAVLLHRNGWADAQVFPLAGDASARRYFRLLGPGAGDRAVLMDAAPGSCGPYMAMTDWLRGHGFAAPRLLVRDAAAGLLLMQDFGDDLVARVCDRQPQMAGPVHDRITDLLVDLHRHPAPGFVPVLDGPVLADQVGLFAQCYLPAIGLDAGRGPAIAAAVADLWQQLCADQPAVVALRDFHAENIVWRGGKPLGLLDFQDAVATHPAYDLVSVLQDVRRDIPPALEAAQIARYLAATGLDADRFRAAYALLGAQRNLRIMGIFARLCRQDGKPRYLAFMPRTWALIRRDLAHPALAPLAGLLADLPDPTPQMIERIAHG
ncbi:tRNA (adenosine(37)-N6)-threonylcarbamoyltransferase complex ATPase subunit type 1 TsaE [Paracoccus jiaweipingae]|uniref:tRNA (adenosine(37)-N6)-threonylcarbamoyltransferase complex ATPase subunit type 1 TsaE n=1 Tax=unclassified Paracoccus (in: a-proteobacteria) TaxID=2688777 RepID=UPI0037B9FA30